MDRIKICGITTRPGTAKIMVPTLTYVAERGYDSYLICQPCDNFRNGSISPITYIPVEMGRGAVSPIEVIKCTYRPIRYLKIKDLMWFSMHHQMLDCMLQLQPGWHMCL